jgi:hypothetical protein
MASKYKMPDLTNATPAGIIDELGKLSIVENYAKKLRAFYKEAFYARTGINPLESGQAQVVEGEIFNMNVSQYETTQLNQDKLKAEFPEAYEACLRHPTITTLRPTVKDAALNPDMDDLIKQIYAELDLGEPSWTKN